MKSKLLTIALLATICAQPSAFSASKGQIVEATKNRDGKITSEGKAKSALEVLKEERGFRDLKESEKETLLKSIKDTGTRAADLGKVYLKASPEGRTALLKLLAQPRDNGDVNLSIVFISRLGSVENLSGERLALFNKLTELSAELPAYLKDNAPLTKEAKESLRSGNKPKTYRELLETALRTKEANTIDAKDFLDTLTDILGKDLVAALLSCKA